VTDDEEFYGRGGTGTSTTSPRAGASGGTDSLSLSQARAVVTSLNSLVYHTYLPVNPTSLQSGASNAAGVRHQPQQGFTPAHPGSSAAGDVMVMWLVSGDPTEVLTEAAPQLLRSLYERDTR
jgi:hypothetical protein